MSCEAVRQPAGARLQVLSRWGVSRSSHDRNDDSRFALSERQGASCSDSSELCARAGHQQSRMEWRPHDPTTRALSDRLRSIKAAALMRKKLPPHHANGQRQALVFLVDRRGDVLMPHPTIARANRWCRGCESTRGESAQDSFYAQPTQISPRRERNERRLGLPKQAPVQPTDGSSRPYG